MTETYYSILGLPKNATTKQIRDRFLHLARDRHPDRFAAEDKQKAEAEFQRITQAYNILHDPARRRQYDQDLEVQARGATEASRSQAARVYLRRGVDAYKKNRFQEAFDNFERATREDPQDAQSWYYLARVCVQRPSWLSRGLAAATRACELAPTNAEYLRLAGGLAAKAGMTTRAMKYYHDALTFGGEDPEVRQALQELRGSSG